MKFQVPKLTGSLTLAKTYASRVLLYVMHELKIARRVLCKLAYVSMHCHNLIHGLSNPDFGMPHMATTYIHLIEYAN